MRVRDFIGNLFFPPFCVACEYPLGVESTDALCPACRKLLENEEVYVCPLCHRKQKECECLPKVLSRYAERGVHLAEYTKDKSVTRSLVLYAKDHNERYLFSFLGEKLAGLVKERMDISGLVVTYVPRSRKKAAQVGVDPSEETAKELAARLGLPCISTLSHRGSQQQKELTAAGRWKNASVSYELKERRRPVLVGKRILLLDDVITTGATMAACARLLRLAGAVEVIPVSVGMTYGQREARQKDAVHKSYRVKNKFPY